MTTTMSVEVSRALAAFVTRLGLGQETARELAARYASTTNVGDLPSWIVEDDDYRSMARPKGPAGNGRPVLGAAAVVDLLGRRVDPTDPTAPVLPRPGAEAYDEAVEALLAALAELQAAQSRAWNPAKHPRNPKGSSGGGRFRSTVDRIKDAIQAHLDGDGDGDPFDGFSREQLRLVAKKRGISLERGEDRDSIAKKLLDDLRGKDSDLKAPDKPKPRKRVPVKKSAPSQDRIDALQRRLAEVADEAKPIAEEIAKRLESKKFHSHNEDLAYYDRLDRLKKLGEQGQRDASELLDLITERDGAPWGGDPDLDLERWSDFETSAGAIVPGESRLDMGAWTKLRDRYVVADKNTIDKNASLRSGSPTAAAKSWAAQMRTLVRTGALARDTKVHRGAALRPEQVAQLRPGAIVRDLGIVSAAADVDEAENYASQRHERLPGTIRTLFEIRARKGTPAVNVGYGEVVLDHGSDFRIVSSRRGKDGVVYVVMELVP